MHISILNSFIFILLLDGPFQVECVKINQFSDSVRYEKEENLLNDLLAGYNPLILPTPNNSESVKVNVGVTFIQLLSINEQLQVMKSNVMLTVSWFDYQLKWDPSEYHGIKKIRLPSDKVWQPDIVLLNNADGNYEVIFKANVVVIDSGLVKWMPPAIYLSTCPIDVRYFPFDHQTCAMKFASWTFAANEVQINAMWDGSVDFSDFRLSGTWDVSSGVGHVNYYQVPSLPFLPNNKTDITFNILVTRKSLFYIVHLILPTMLISLLSVFTFLLPTDSQEKITLGISLLLSLVVFLTMLVKKFLPPTSLAFPLIAKYVVFTFIMNLMSMATSVCVINVNHRETRHMPNGLKWGFLVALPWLLFMDRPRQHRYRANRDGKEYKEFLDPDDEVLVPPFTTECGINHTNCKYNKVYPHRLMNSEYGLLSPEMFCPNKALHSLHYMSMDAKESYDQLEKCEDWKFMAMVIDRLLMYIFFLVTVGGTFALLYNTP